MPTDANKEKLTSVKFVLLNQKNSAWVDPAMFLSKC